MEFIYQLEETIRELSNMTEVDFKQYISDINFEGISDQLKKNLINYYFVAYNLSKKIF